VVEILGVLFFDERGKNCWKVIFRFHVLEATPTPNENVVNCSGVSQEGEKRSGIHPSEIPNPAGDSSPKQVHVCIAPVHPLGHSHITTPVNNNPFEWKFGD